MARHSYTGVVARLRRTVTDYRAYRRTIDELSMLNSRELSGLGLTRHDIVPTARAAVYGR